MKINKSLGWTLVIIYSALFIIALASFYYQTEITCKEKLDAIKGVDLMVDCFPPSSINMGILLLIGVPWGLLLVNITENDYFLAFVNFLLNASILYFIGHLIDKRRKK